MAEKLQRFLGHVGPYVACLLALAVAPLPLHAQESTTTGSIAGTVLNPDGTPADNARVVAVNVDRGTQVEALTGENGRFVFALLQPGQYMIRAEKPPQPETELGPIRISVGQRNTVTLELRPVEVEEVGVRVRRTGGDVAQGGVAELVGEEQISQLPTPGRDFTDFIELSGLVSPQPGVSTGGQFAIAGARTSDTNVQIDGADANNAFFGENRGSSRVPFSFSLESIKEFQIVTNGYDVEYGRYSGGVMNAVTKSGSNEFRGSAHLFWRDEALTSNNFNNESPTDFQAFQFGGTASGPIIEDKLHYFVSGDFQQWDQPTFALTPERSPFSQGTVDQFTDIMVNEYGFDRSEVESNIGTFTETQDQASVFARLDWTLNENHRVAVRANYLDFENVNDRIGTGGTEARTVGGTFHDEALSVVGELNSVFSDRVFNVFRVQVASEDRPRPGNSRLPSAEINVTENGQSVGNLVYGGAFFGILYANNLEEDKIQITDNLTFRLGEDHTVKVGTDNVFTNTFNKFWLNGNGFFTFDSMEDFANRNPGFFFRLTPDLQDPSPPIADFSTEEYSFYVQDEWEATDRLSVTLGLRYDYTSFGDTPLQLENLDFRSAVNDRTWTWNGEPVEATETSVPDDTDNFSPRLSFTYDVDGDGGTTLRGGAGLFYSRIPKVTHGNVLSSTPNPLLAVICIGSATPDFDYAQWKGGENIPNQCKFQGVDFPGGEFGLGIIGAPEISLWNAETEQPETFKANLGLDHEFSPNWRGNVQAIFSQTSNHFGAVDLNLADAQFATAEGRPVHVEEGIYDPTDSPSSSDRAVDPDLSRLYMQTSMAKSRSFNFNFGVQGNPTPNLQVAANYTLNLSYDNKSVPCCTANALMFDTPTAGNPNFIGKRGSSDIGSWGPTDWSRRHVFVMNGIWNLPADFTVSAIYRAQSGNPYTPDVSGDLNQDGDDGNDRPYIPDPHNPEGMQFASAEDRQMYQRVFNQFECLQEAAGSIINRNTCSDPWWHSLDLKLTKSFRTAGSQRAEIVLDMFNVLDGLGFGAGEFMAHDEALFRAEGYDPDTQEVIYSVRTTQVERDGEQVTIPRFGRELPVGFEPFQFQAQLGIRYHF